MDGIIIHRASLVRVECLGLEFIFEKSIQFYWPNPFSSSQSFIESSPVMVCESETLYCMQQQWLA